MKGKVLRAVFGTALLLIVAASICQGYLYYSHNFWAMDQSKHYLYLASESPDMPQMIDYMARAGGYLQPYSGNPSFTLSPYDDLNTVKQRLASTIATMQRWGASAKPVQDYAYQQAVANIHNTIEDIREEIGDIEQMMFTNPAWNPIGYLLLTIYFAYIVLLFRATKSS